MADLQALLDERTKARNELSFLVNNPRPDAEAERALWRTIIVNLTKQIDEELRLRRDRFDAALAMEDLGQSLPPDARPESRPGQ